MSAVADRLVKIGNAASSAAGFLRDTGAISTGLSAIGQDKAAEVVRSLGLGRKKRSRSTKSRKGKGRKRVSHGKVRKSRKHRGGSIFGDILGKITSIPAGLAMGALAGTQGAISGLGKRRRRHRGGIPDPSKYRSAIAPQFVL